MPSRQRDVNIETIRVVAMFLVVVVHISRLLHKDIWLSAFLWALSFCAVNVFGLLSGYVGFGSNHRISRFAELWLQVFYYSAGITVLYWIYQPEAVGTKVFLKSLFPFSSVAYWYFTAYCGLFFLMPLLDSSIVSLPQRKIRTLLLSLGGVFCVLSAFRCSPDDILGLGYGYSLTWLCMLYLFGAYLRKYGWLSRHGCFFWIIGYFVSVTLLLFCDIASKRLEIFVLKQYTNSYAALPAVISAICVLGICTHISIPIVFQKIISSISPYAFGVYLLHTHPLVFKTFFVNNTSNPLYSILNQGWGFTAIIVAIGIFSIGILIDSIRGFLFKYIKIQNRLCVFDKWYV